MRTPLSLSFIVAMVALSAAAIPTVVTAQPAYVWEIGPLERGRNFSAGMPSSPTRSGRGWYFDFPYPNARAGHVNYVTTKTGSLLGKSRIVMRYRVDARPGVRLEPRENPRARATLSLYFQRRGDNWTARRQFEHYRWFATPAARVPLAPGEHKVSLTFDPRNWKSIMSATGTDVPVEFGEALRNAERVGFVLGGGGSAGHGVYATGPARFTLISFRIV